MCSFREKARPEVVLAPFECRSVVLGTRVTRWQCRKVAVWRAMRVLGAPVSDLVFRRNRKNPRPCTLVPGGWPLLAAARQRSIESRYAIYVSQEAFLAFIETHSVSGRDCRLKSEELVEEN